MHRRITICSDLLTQQGNIWAWFNIISQYLTLSYQPEMSSNSNVKETTDQSWIRCLFTCELKNDKHGGKCVSDASRLEQVELSNLFCSNITISNSHDHVNYLANGRSILISDYEREQPLLFWEGFPQGSRDLFAFSLKSNRKTSWCWVRRWLTGWRSGFTEVTVFLKYINNKYKYRKYL